MQNGRRLAWLAQSLREYQAQRGAPPANLTMLNVWRDNLLDVFGTPIEYRVAGTPARWEIRSAGADRRFDDRDAWIVGP